MPRARRSPRLPLLALAGALCLAVAGCSVFEPVPLTAERDELAAARRRWAQAGVRDYSYVYQRSCECLAELTQPAIVIVRNDVVDSVRFVAGGYPTIVNTGTYPTVDELFATIDEIYARRPARVQVRYDRVLGYPRELSVDMDAAIADDEFGFTTGALLELH